MIFWIKVEYGVAITFVWCIKCEVIMGAQLILGLDRDGARCSNYEPPIKAWYSTHECFIELL